MRLLLGILFLSALAALFLWPSTLDWRSLLGNGAALREGVRNLGAWGPLGVVGLMTLAVVLSPLPSAPIALASGTLYGHAWGALYVLAGSVTGAMIAFFLARSLGYQVIRRRFGAVQRLEGRRSQNALMAIVFVSRLLPLLSFDLISYAAGLTPLNPWRFLLATVAGVAPASFLLAHFGQEMGGGEEGRWLVSVLALGCLAALTLAIQWWWDRRRNTAVEQ